MMLKIKTSININSQILNQVCNIYCKVIKGMLGNERRLVLRKEGISEITFDLDAFKVNLFESNQDLRFCSSDLEFRCKLLGLKSDKRRHVSSANRCAVEKSRAFCISLTYNIKRRGPKTEP